MRKWIALLLVLLLLTGCSQPAAPDNQEPAERIGLCLRGADSALDYSLLAQAMQQQGWQVTLVDAGQDQTVQTHQIKEFAGQGYSLLVIEPVMWDGVDLLIEQLRQADMPAVLVGSAAQTDALGSWDRICYVGSTNESPAVAQAQLLRGNIGADINGDGVICYGVLAGPEELQSTQDQLTVYASQLPQHRLLKTEYSQLGQEEGTLLCSRLLAQFGPDLEVLLCHSDALALGALEALQEAGRTAGTDVLVIGSGASREALEMLRDGQLVGTVYFEQQVLHETLIAAAKDLMAGTAVDAVQLIDWQPVDRQRASTLLTE